MPDPINGQIPHAQPPQTQQDPAQTIQGLLFNPLNKTENYALVVLAEFIPNLGHGMYGIVNRDTTVVEASIREYPAAFKALLELQEAYTTATADEQNPQ